MLGHKESTSSDSHKTTSIHQVCVGIDVKVLLKRFPVVCAVTRSDSWPAQAYM